VRATLIDLFAGAGGLSLGLDAAGFESVLAVEASPMAAETYFRNFIDRDVDEWVRHETNRDVDAQIAKGLAVSKTGVVLDHVESVRRRLRDHPLDLLAGGPPCQGFSLAGMRNPADQRNQLPFEFLRFVDELRPRAVLIENVVGIGLSFAKIPGEAPLEQLRKALAMKGYLAQIFEVNARDFGVAQDRPRIMIVGLHLDEVQRLLPDMSAEVLRDVPVARWSSSQPGQMSLDSARSPLDDLLVPACLVDPRRPTVEDALDDLCGVVSQPSDYVVRLNQILVPPAGPDPDGPGNLTYRRHSRRTSLRFQLHLALAAKGVRGDIFSVRVGQASQEAQVNVERDPRKARGRVRLTPEEARDRVLHQLRKLSVSTPLTFRGAPIIDPETDTDVGQDLDSLATAIVALGTLKHSQRALAGSLPSPTILSLPDDFVHHLEPRTLSVREMARLQSFPDAFRFYSKETTGGHSRRIEVPQYTQVGNAVPPWMAYRVGSHLYNLLLRSAARAVDHAGNAEPVR